MLNPTGPRAIGCHLSFSKGYLAMGKEALSIGADTCQFFTRNPRGGSAKPQDERDAAAYIAFAREKGMAPLLAHAPYTLNGCSADAGIRDFARRTMADDLARLEALPGQMYNFHPGSHVGQGVEAGITFIAEMLNAVMTPTMHTTVLLETMAGKGSEIGGDLDGVLTQFDRVIGLHRLHAIHLNDSKNPRGARKDRHEVLGGGHIGLEAILRLIRHPALRRLPILLETPNDLDGYAREIALLKEHDHD